MWCQLEASFWKILSAPDIIIPTYYILPESSLVLLEDSKKIHFFNILAGMLEFV